MININKKQTGKPTWSEYSLTDGYFITTCGRVFSNKKEKDKTKYRELLCRITKAGYKDVGLCYVDADGTTKRRPFSVHKLVAMSYLGKPPTELSVVNHIDSNKLNNSVCNLEWSSVSLNTQHGFRNMRYDSINPILVTEDNKKKLYFRNLSEAIRYYNIPIGSGTHIRKTGKYKKYKLEFEEVEKCNDYPFVE